MKLWQILLVLFILGLAGVACVAGIATGLISLPAPARVASTPPPTEVVAQETEAPMLEPTPDPAIAELREMAKKLENAIAECGDRGIVQTADGYACKSEPTPMPIQEVISTPTQVVSRVQDVWVGLPECPYAETGSSQPLNKDGSIPIQQKGNLWEADLTVNGCALLFEGRIVPGEELHRIIVLRSKLGENSEFVKGGKFTYAEGSIFGYDRTWNMEDFSTEKPPIAAEFVNDKRAVMLEADYNWPILVYTTDGQVLEFTPGEEWAGVVPNNACEFNEPQQIPVHGEKLSGENRFSAAVGAVGCTTVAWLDGSETPEVWQGQRDAEQKVVYTTIEAWLMPSNWNETQIADWAASHN